jgi:hypothetical protein
MFGELNEKQAEYTEDILSSGRHLLSLINEILDLSKIEAGRMELELTKFDLPLAIENARTFVRERATKHGITLDVAVDERLSEFTGDERKIQQILLSQRKEGLRGQDVQAVQSTLGGAPQGPGFRVSPRHYAYEPGSVASGHSVSSREFR